IAVYKNIDALRIVLDSIATQSMSVDEIIIAEDGHFDEMAAFLYYLKMDNLINFTKDDLGWRKALSLNNAIKKASGDYLIFIDGDVVPHSRFIEGHITSATRGIVFCGKRSELGEKTSKAIYDGSLHVRDLQKRYLINALALHVDGVRHYEEGLYVKPHGIIHNWMKERVVKYIIGCNFSCFKDDFVAINGFDEDYTQPTVGEDIDLGWRFIGMGIQLRSVRQVAVVYHLWHKKNFDTSTIKENDKILLKNFEVNRYVCLNGLEKLKDDR
ncbi:MAG: glycosyltransferase, partial [Campylobacterota bacterium]|nr:glycosyltransferase [Campylobacterota bacterium]